MDEYIPLIAILVAIAGAWWYKKISRRVAAAEKQAAKEKGLLCVACGFQGEPKMKTPGLFAVEIILWMCLILPGLAYTIWRSMNRYPVCPSCGSKNMIPIDSPVAVRFREKLS